MRRVRCQAEPVIPLIKSGRQGLSLTLCTRWSRPVASILRQETISGSLDCLGGLDRRLVQAATQGASMLTAALRRRVPP